MFPLDDSPVQRTFPVINWLIIVANVIVFLMEISVPEGQLNQVIEVYGFTPHKFLTELGPQQISTIGTSMFMHAGWMHLIMNMWFLFIFGDNVEDRFGHIQYLVFYLSCGLLADGAHLLAGTQSTIPSVGASGAISGVLGAYIVMFPHARIKTFATFGFLVRLFELPAPFYLGFWFLSQLVPGLVGLGQVQSESGGVAWWAHIGGFLAGLALVKLFDRPKARQLSYDNADAGRYQ